MNAKEAAFAVLWVYCALTTLRVIRNVICKTAAAISN